MTVTDVARNHVCLAWDSTPRSPLLREFAALAEDLHGAHAPQASAPA